MKVGSGLGVVVAAVLAGACSGEVGSHGSSPGSTAEGDDSSGMTPPGSPGAGGESAGSTSGGRARDAAALSDVEADPTRTGTRDAGDTEDLRPAEPDAAAAGDALGGRRSPATPFIMDTWFWSSADPVPSRVNLLERLGWKGMALSAGFQVKEYLDAMRAKGLPMPGIWTPVNAASYPTGVVKSIAGTGGWIWLTVSAASGDDATLKLINRLADECKSQGVAGVALYPHAGTWLSRVGDAVRLAGKAARPDVGVVFNQYHWMATGEGDLGGTLKRALPYLKAVTINGSDKTASILPLGTGAYDVSPILRTLADLGYQGSIGLQGYGIKGDLPAKLAGAKSAWDRMTASTPF